MVLGYGFCSGLGLFYSAAHTVIPFLLLGNKIPTLKYSGPSNLPNDAVKMAYILILKLEFIHDLNKLIIE